MDSADYHAEKELFHEGNKPGNNYVVKRPNKKAKS